MDVGGEQAEALALGPLEPELREPLLQFQIEEGQDLLSGQADPLGGRGVVQAVQGHLDDDRLLDDALLHARLDVQDLDLVASFETKLYK